MRRAAAGLALGAVLWVLSTAPALAGPCDAMARLKMRDIHVDRVTEVGPDRPFTPPVPDAAPMRQSFCRVEGRIEREIGFELWLPAKANWNGRLLTGGVGGQAGNFNYRELIRAVARGYVGASTDAGHKADDRHWLLKRPDRAANYAWRANHLLAVQAKAMIARAYGRPVDQAFFVGCSGGGRQALTAVQRFPTDYDGVIAGAPGVNTPAMSARRMWEMQRHSDWGASVPAWTWPWVQQQAVAQCDGLDGVIDGVVADPRQCHFDVTRLACGTGRPGQCLSPAQVGAVQRISAPLHDENGKQLDQGLLPTVLISPAPLPEPFTPGPSYLATVLFADGVHGDPAWDARQFSLARDLPEIDRLMNLNADDPAIEPFVSRGGKLLLYQGWDDPLVSAQSTLGYWDALSARFGSQLGASVRLFMAPGVDHCRGGAGQDLFGGAGGDAPVVDPQHDMLSALERWVLAGEAPSRIIAVKQHGGRTVRSQPLCAWPARAVWSGRGDPADAASYTCQQG